MALTPFSIGGVSERVPFALVKPPLRALCRINEATGWLVAPSIVATAAHCVSGMSRATITTLTGQSIEGAVSRFAVPPGTGTANDMALILLDDDFPVPALKAAIYPIHFQGDVVVAGIPDADRDLVFQDRGALVGQNNGLLHYAINTFSGHSGAPVLLASKPNAVVGIHVAAGDSGFNTGLFFTDAHLNFIASKDLTA